jgi:hypothetical protein
MEKKKRDASLTTPTINAATPASFCSIDKTCRTTR